MSWLTAVRTWEVAPEGVIVADPEALEAELLQGAPDPSPVPFWVRQHDIPDDPDDTSDPWIHPGVGTDPVTQAEEEA